MVDTEGGFGEPIGGVYHGKVKFPPEYPYKPPGIRFVYPSLVDQNIRSQMLYPTAPKPRIEF